MIILFYSLFTYAQEQKIRLQSDGPVSIAEVLGQIERQTNMTVAYNEKSLDVSRLVKVTDGLTSVKSVLDDILNGTGMTI